MATVTAGGDGKTRSGMCGACASLRDLHFHVSATSFRAQAHERQFIPTTRRGDALDALRRQVGRSCRAQYRGRRWRHFAYANLDDANLARATLRDEAINLYGASAQRNLQHASVVADGGASASTSTPPTCARPTSATPTSRRWAPSRGTTPTSAAPTCAAPRSPPASTITTTAASFARGGKGRRSGARPSRRWRPVPRLPERGYKFSAGTLLRPCVGRKRIDRQAHFYRLSAIHASGVR